MTTTVLLGSCSYFVSDFYVTAGRPHFSIKED